jgi:hypothetical protein
MIKFYVAITIILVLVFILNDKTRWIKKIKTYRYTKKEFLMTRAEHEFFDILVSIISNNFNNQYYIFPQVHISEFLEHKIKGQSWKGAFSHINGKSVDFVLCDKNYIKPILAIELDDRTHDRPDRVDRDEEVERVLKEAHLPLLRFPSRSKFDENEIVRQINNVLLPVGNPTSQIC